MNDNQNIYLNIKSRFPRPLIVHMNTFKHQQLFKVKVRWFSILLLAAKTTVPSPGNSERQKEFEHIVKDFDPAEKGETSEEAHCAPNKAQLSLSCHLQECILASVRNCIFCHLNVPFNLIVGGRVKEDVHSLQWSMLDCGS